MRERLAARPSTASPSPLADSILRLIWKERRISRADLARETALARSTISSLVGSLLPTGLVAEVGFGESRGGRRPIVLEFQDDAAVILGVEMGAGHVAVAATNLRGHVLAWRVREHPVRDDPDGTRRIIGELCERALETAAYDPDRLVGIGLAVPCPIDPRAPNRLSPVVLPAWDGRLDLGFVAERWDVPLMVDNDANLGALAERWWGVAQNVNDFAYVKVSFGIGSGHVMNGEIYRGATGVAGEIGHLNVDPHGDPCVCGHRGCLVTLVGTPALIARATALLADHPGSSLAKLPITIDALEDAALAGDPLASQVVDEAAVNLGIALAGALNLLNPSLVIIGGGLARLGERLLVPLREEVTRRTLVSSVAVADVRTSDLGPRSVAVGASTLVLKNALAESKLFPTVARLESR